MIDVIGLVEGLRAAAGAAATCRCRRGPARSALLVGANGCGKSTTLRAARRALGARRRPHRCSTATTCGLDPARALARPVVPAAVAALSRAADGRPDPRRSTPACAACRRSRVDVVPPQWGLTGYRHEITGRLSGGTRQRLGLAVLDAARRAHPDARRARAEPRSGLAPGAARSPARGRGRGPDRAGRDAPARRMGRAGGSLPGPRRADRSSARCPPTAARRLSVRVSGGSAGAGQLTEIHHERPRTRRPRSRPASVSSRPTASTASCTSIWRSPRPPAACRFSPRTKHARAAPLWVLHAVLYCLSLSALLLGLSSAHAEADEFPLLFAQPAPRWAWLLGKSAAIALVLTAASLLLVLPAALLGGTWRRSSASPPRRAG